MNLELADFVPIFGHFLLSKMTVLKLKPNAEDLVSDTTFPRSHLYQELFLHTNDDSTAVKMHSGYGQNDKTL